jgi:DNA polymerase (family 10)
MKNHELAVIFGRIADVLELLEEDKFRVNSYRRVARTLEDHPEDVAALAAVGKLQTVPGVGKSTAEKIDEYLKTGRVTLYDELAAKVPAGLMDLLKISGMGPKTTALLWKKVKVESLDDLAAALEAGKLADLPGMGEKKIDNIRKGLAEVRQMQASGAATRTLLGIALPIAEEIAARLRKLSGVDAAVPAGSLRRRRESIGDIDIVVSGDAGPPVLDAFVKFPEVRQVLAHGDTKASVKIVDGLQVDVRVVPAESFGAALLYFTGSKDHNIRMRELAIKKGWKLNEWGLFEADKRLAGKTEEEVYKKLGLAWIAPEMREDRGELAAAAEGRLPELVEPADIRGDLHLHTTASDGRNSIVEMAQAAKALGYKYIAITDHSQSLTVGRGLTVERLRAHVKAIREAEKQVPGLRIFAGSEVDILPDGSLDYPDAVLAELDVVIGSIHSAMKQTPAEATARLVKAIANPYLHCVGHPTARYILKRPPVPADMAAVVAAARKHGAALEVNASMERLDLNDQHCRMAVEAGVPLLIDTDAHSTEGFRQMELGVATARRGWATRADVLNTRTAAQFEKWLHKRRPAG